MVKGFGGVGGWVDGKYSKKMKAQERGQLCAFFWVCVDGFLFFFFSSVYYTEFSIFFPFLVPLLSVQNALPLLTQCSLVLSSLSRSF